MKITSSLIQHVIEIREDRVASLVIEHQPLFRAFVSALRDAVEENEDTILFSDQEVRLRAASAVEVVQTFTPLTLNTKSLLAALVKRMEQIAQAGGRRDETSAALSTLDEYVMRLTLEIPHEVTCDGLNMTAVLKAVGLSFVEDGNSVANLLLDYMRLVREFTGKRLFVLVNSRLYLSDCELRDVLSLCLADKLFVLLVDGVERPLLPGEDRLLMKIYAN